MIILGVECSALSAGAAVLENGKLVAENFVNCGLTHSETLMPMIDSALKMAGKDIDDVDLIAVSDGPGSFTGLRIGIGTVKGLAMGAGKKVLGVSPLRALCFGVKGFGGKIAALMDARRGQVYCAVYKWESDKLTEITEPSAMPLSELLMSLKDEEVMYVGDGASAFKEEIKEKQGNNAYFPSESFLFQRASFIAAAAEGHEGIDEKLLQPFYLRRPQAERERLEKGQNIE